MSGVVLRSSSRSTDRPQVKSKHINSHQSSVYIVSWVSSHHSWPAAFSAAWSHWESSAGWWAVCIALNCRDHRSIYKYVDTRLPFLSLAIGDPFKLTSPAQHASRWRMRGSQTCRLLHRPRGRARMRHRENRRDREFMLGNSRTKLPVRCMLGRRGQFEGVADWLSMLPLWSRSWHWRNLMF